MAHENPNTQPVQPDITAMEHGLATPGTTVPVEVVATPATEIAVHFNVDTRRVAPEGTAAGDLFAFENPGTQPDLSQLTASQQRRHAVGLRRIGNDAQYRGTHSGHNTGGHAAVVQRQNHTGAFYAEATRDPMAVIEAGKPLPLLAIDAVKRVIGRR